MNNKEIIQYATAIGLVISGVVLSYISFFMDGDIADTVLWYFAQTLIFAGAVFGVNLMVDERVKKNLESHWDLTRKSKDETKKKR